MAAKNVNTLLSLNQLPIIDLAEFELNGVHDEKSLKSLALQLRTAISEKGMALLINHGISGIKIQNAWNSFDNFLKLPSEVQDKYKRLPNSTTGYVKPGQEVLDKERRAEIRHSFDICEFLKEKIPSEVPDFYQNIFDLSNDYLSLTNLLLESIALAMEMPINFFTDNHKNILKNNNGTTLRLLYYPPISEDIKDVKNFIRCGAHRDYGTFTLLSQDSEGGLEIKLPGNEEWQRVGYLADSILINCGEVLSLWTKDRYPAVNHRVVIPNEIDIKNRDRHSIAFFVHPDNETIISSDAIPYPGNELEQCEDKNYTAYEHLQKRFRESYL